MCDTFELTIWSGTGEKGPNKNCAEIDNCKSRVDICNPIARHRINNNRKKRNGKIMIIAQQGGFELKNK